MEYEVFLHQDGYGFRVSNQETAQLIVQLYDPTLPGFAPMSEEVAEARAKELVDSIVNTPLYAPQKSSVIGIVTFLNRLTCDERKAFLRLKEQVRMQYSQGVASNSLTPELEELNDFLVMFDKASEIDLTYPTTIAGITYLGKNFLGASDERIAEILKV